MRILLVEDNPGDIRLLREYLKEAGTDRYQITHADRLARGLERLAEANVDAVLLDLSLPDSHGMDTLVRMREAAKAVPIVVLTGIEDEALGMRLIQAGAQDYLIKGQVTGPLLTRSLRYAVERKRAEGALRDSEERYRHLVEGARDVIITLSKDGVITSLNPAFERITQWACDEWIGQPIAPLFHADDLPLAFDLFRHIAEHGEALTRVLRIRSHDRGYVVGEFVGVPHVQNGQTSGLLVIGRDITERKRVEDTLERLRHLYGLLLTSAPDGIYGIDLQGNAIFVNPAAARMLGSSGEELLGRHMHDIAHHTKPDGTRYSSEECPIYRALCGGVIQHVADDVFWRTDGTSFPVEYTSTPIVEQNGIVGAVVMFRDITERKRAEAELCESEARLRAILDNSPGMVFLKDTEGRYLDVNCQFERTFHINREEIAGKTDDEVFPSEQAAAFRANDLTVLQAGVPMQFEEVALHDDGPHTSVVYKFPLSNGEGKPYGIYGITADITARKAMEEALRQAEEKYRSIVENAVEGIFQSTPGGRYLSVNPALARMYGYESSEELMGSVTDITHKLYVDPDRRTEMMRLLEWRGVLQGFEYEVYRKDGSRIWISESARVVRDEGGRTLYYEGTIEDVTERKRAEEELQRTLGQMRTLSRRLEVVREQERTRIARELHDELGVRMACLKMDLARMQTMRGDTSPVKLEEKILSMTDQVDTTIAAVQDLVAELRPGVLDDLGLVAAVEWQCRDFERRSGIRCVLDFKQEDIPLDSMRATAAFRICQEALTNVLRHAAAKEIRVRLELVDRQLLLDIQDDGQGISPEKVYDVRSFGLLGMRERADAVGGVFRIVGVPGLGTTVSLRLPCD
jgi:PAS domain S-box-containing protein